MTVDMAIGMLALAGGVGTAERIDFRRKPMTPHAIGGVLSKAAAAGYARREKGRMASLWVLTAAGFDLAKRVISSRPAWLDRRIFKVRK